MEAALGKGTGRNGDSGSAVDDYVHEPYLRVLCDENRRDWSSSAWRNGMLAVSLNAKGFVLHGCIETIECSRDGLDSLSYAVMTIHDVINRKRSIVQVWMIKK